MGDDGRVKVGGIITIDTSQIFRQFTALALESEKASRKVANNLKSINEATLPNMAAQVAGLQARLKLENISSVALKAQVQAHAEAVSKLREKVALEGKLTTEHKQQVKELQMQAKVLNANVSEAAALQRATLGGTFKNMLGRRLEWFASGALAFGAAAGARNVINDVADIEMRMISLSRVLDDPLFKINEMRDSLFSLGQEFGFGFQEVQDIALRWAQAGYDVQESLEATRASLLALNTAELNAEQATQSLIGIMAQWGMSTNQLTGVIDRINLVADEYAVSSQDIVDGLLRSSGAARAANMTFEQTVAMLTAMRESSGRTGKEVGNALNSIIAYLQRAKSLNTFDAAGIAVFANPEGTQLRSTFDLLADISAKWAEMEQSGLSQVLMDEAEAAGLFTESMAEAGGALEEWTDLQKRDILSAGAGVYRRNYLLALLNNFTQVYDVLNVQERALGYSQRENARTMEGYTKQVAAMKTELQELGYAIAAEGGPLDFLKAIVSGVRSVVDWFNKLSPSTKELITALGLIGINLGALNFILKQTSGVGIKGMITALFSLKGGLAAVKTAAMTTGSSLLAMAPVLIPVIAAVAALGYAYVETNKQAMRLQDTFSRIKEDADTEIRALEAQVKTHASAAKSVVELTDKYRALEIERKQSLEEGGDATRIAAEQEDISRRIEEAIGRESAARLKAANYSEEAAEAVRKAEMDKVSALNEAIAEKISGYRRDLEAQTQAALDSITVVENQIQGWETYLTLFERLKLVLTRWGVWMRQAYADWAYDWNMFLYNIVSGTADLARSVKLTGMADSLDSTAGGFFERAYEHRARSWQLDKELAEKEAAIAEGPLKRQREHLTDLREELNRVAQAAKDLNGGGGGGGFGGGGGGFGGGDEESIAKRIRSIVDAIVAETEALGRLDDAIERDVTLRKERIAYMTREGASVDELQQADRDRADLMALLSDRQGMLHQQAEAARTAYAALADVQAQLDTSTEEGAEAYATLGDAMERMLSIAGQNSAEWWRLQREQADLAKENNAVSVETIRRLKELQTAYDGGTLSLGQYKLALGALADQAGLSDEAVKALREEQERIAEGEFSDALEELERLYSDGYLSLEQYIRGLSELEQQGFSTADALAKLREAQSKALREFYSTSLEKEADRIERAYKDATDRIDRQLERSLDRVDRRLKDKIGRWQEELAALEGEQTDIDRDRAGDEHERTIADLQEQRRYHELRLGREHEEALQDIDRQIAEENRRWEEQQQDWELSDRREYLQDKIDQAEEAAKEERERLEKEAERQREDLEEHYERVKEITEEGILDTIAALAATDAQWFDTGKSLIDRLIEGLESGNFAEVLRRIDRVRQAAEEAASAATGLTFGASAVPSASYSGGGHRNIAAYATGAWEIPHTQFALLHPQETVLPAYAAQAFRSFAPTISNLDGLIEAAVNRVVQAILSRPGGEMKVYGAENAYLDDSVDVDMLSHQVARQVARVY